MKDTDYHSEYGIESLSQNISRDAETVKQLQGLTNAILTISSELDLDRVLQRIADMARQFAGAHYAAMGVVGEDGLITSFITSGISKEEREKIGEPPRGHGLLGVLIKQGKPLRVRDMTKDPRRSGFPPNHPPMTSLLGVPVSTQGRVIGDLYMTDKIGSDEFTSEDEYWLTLFAQQAAVAVENANLYKKVRIAQQRAETLAELAGKLNRSSHLEELFEQITQAVCALLEVPASALFLVDKDHTKFIMQSEHGLTTNKDEELSLPMEGTAAGISFKQGSPVCVTDAPHLPCISLIRLKDSHNPASIMVVPIRQYGQVTGVIEVFSDRMRSFSNEEVDLLEAFAGHAALALEKAQLYKHKEEFLSMTAHDLRAPLTAIKMSAGLLESSLPSDLPPALSRLAANITHNSERLNTMLTDLLDLTRLEQGKIQIKPEPVELSEFITATSQALLPLFEEKQQAFVFERNDSVQVQADKRRLEQALVNLLSNANKYAPEGGTVEVRLNKAADSVTIEVIDNGPGIPPEEQKRVFDRYYRRLMHEKGSGAIHGTGLGLPIARHLVELHGGQIWVESTPGAGSTFCMKLPL